MAVSGLYQEQPLGFSAADRLRGQSIIRDRDSPQSCVWRARIILSSADSVGTMAIMHALGKDNTVV